MKIVILRTYKAEFTTSQTYRYS